MKDKYLIFMCLTLCQRKIKKVYLERKKEKKKKQLIPSINSFIHFAFSTNNQVGLMNKYLNI